MEAERMRMMLDDGMIRKLCNPNYSFPLGEDIYQRFRFPFDAVEPGSRVVIYGGGVVGKIFLQQVARSAYCTVVAICDQCPETTGILEIPVINIASLAGMSEQAYDMVIIAIEKRSIAKEIYENLRMAGLSVGKIRWINPSANTTTRKSMASGQGRMAGNSNNEETAANFYRYLLGREPESPAAVRKYVKKLQECEFSAIREEFLRSEEFQKKYEAFRMKDSCRKEDGTESSLGFSADRRFEFPWGEVPQGSRIVIYGGGVVGKTFAFQVLQRAYVRLLAICDRDPAQTGIRSLPVITLSQLSKLRQDSYDMVLIANEKQGIAEDIIENLLEEGIPEEKIKWVDPRKR